MPLNGEGQRGESDGGTIELIEVYWLRTYADRMCLEIEELPGEKIWGSQIGPRLRPKLKE